VTAPESRVVLGDYTLAIPTSYGPRILDLSWQGHPSLFVHLDDSVALEGPEGSYPLRGGHRLWAAPEVAQVTYVSDDRRCEVSEGEDTVTVTGAVDSAGLQKAVTIRESGGRLVVEHELVNRGEAARRVAPWAITQLRLGGVAICPLPPDPEKAPQADRSLVLWPYTDLSDTRFGWRRDAVVLRAEAGPQIKVGTGPAPRRLGYFLDGQLFVKEIPSARAEAAHADRGAVAQVYCNDRFLELESLGPLVTLEPGETAAHEETWRVSACEDVEEAFTRIVEEST